MDVEPWIIECEDCDFEDLKPTRDTAGHAKRVHEAKFGHTALVTPAEE
jgi:hypothetical protein